MHHDRLPQYPPPRFAPHILILFLTLFFGVLRGMIGSSSGPQSLQLDSILTVAQISLPGPVQRVCDRAARLQGAAKTVSVWPQG